MRFRVMARVAALGDIQQNIRAEIFEHFQEQEARKHYSEVAKRIRGSHVYEFQQAVLERERGDGTWERIDQLTKEQLR